MNNRNRNKELLNNTIIIGIGSICSRLISFILVPLYTMWLTVDEYGRFDLLNSYISLVVPILTLQIEQAMIRFSIEKRDNSRACVIIATRVVLCTSILVLIFFPLLKFKYNVTFTICAIVYAYEIIFTEYLRGINELKKYAIASIICGVANLIFTVIFVKIFNLGVNGIFVAFSCAYGVTAIYSFFVSKLYCGFFERKVDTKLIKMMFLYALPLLPNALSWWITSVSDRTLINYFLGENYNGIYAVGSKIPTILAVFYSVFNLAWQQSAMVSSNDKLAEKQKFYRNTFATLIDVIYCGTICVICFSPLFYRFFINKEYWSGIPLVPILVLASAELNLSQYLGGILLADKRTKVNGATTVIAAIINIIVNAIFIKSIGLYAAAISTYVCYVVFFILRLRKLSIYIDFNSAVVKMIKYNLIAMVFAWISIYNDSIITLILLMLISVILFVYINRNLLTTLMKKILRGKI